MPPPPPPPKKKKKNKKKEQKQGRSYCFGLCEVRAYKHKCCYCFLPSLNMNQVPENCLCQ